MSGFSEVPRLRTIDTGRDPKEFPRTERRYNAFSFLVEVLSYIYIYIFFYTLDEVILMSKNYTLSYIDFF